MRILLVEDDYDISLLLEEILKKEYKVTRAKDGEEALNIFNSFLEIGEKFDLVLLDLMLPKKSGEEVLKELKGKAKIIVLSAKTGKSDRLTNLLEGANDYLIKPFDPDELLVRIKVQLRDKLKDDKIEFEEIFLDAKKFYVSISDIEVKLTKMEFAILELLLRNPNVIFSRSQILEAVFDFDKQTTEESIKVHISNLRTKLNKYTEKQYIETVWGIGFRIVKC